MKQDETCYAWLYGKLLLAALCETLVNEGRFSAARGRKERRAESTNEPVEGTVYGADIGSMSTARYAMGNKYI